MSTIGIIGAMQVELATILEVITTLEKRQIAGSILRLASMPEIKWW